MEDTLVVRIGWTALLFMAGGCSAAQNAPPDTDGGAHDRSDVERTDVVVGDGGSPADAQDGAPAPEADLSETSVPVDATLACSSGQTSSTLASAARSSGFSGTDTAYYATFGAACSAPGDCAPACVTAGGRGRRARAALSAWPGQAPTVDSDVFLRRIGSTQQGHFPNPGRRRVRPRSSSLRSRTTMQSR